MTTSVLQFSGGKDSLACLYLLEPIWDDLTVLWCNTGSAYEETLDLMERVKKLVPHFAEVKSNQPKFIEEYGNPVDVLPIRRTNFGQYIHGTESKKFTDYLSCCNANIWQPVREASKGYANIFRGQRLEDDKKSRIRNGDVIDGQTYLFPIENWTTQDVISYLGERLPKYYQTEKTSHDCWNCTAYLEDNFARIHALPNEKKEYVIDVLKDYRNAIEQDKSYLDGVLNG